MTDKPEPQKIDKSTRALPEVGATYQHKKAGSVVVSSVLSRGKGFQVNWAAGDRLGTDRLRDWEKAISP